MDSFSVSGIKKLTSTTKRSILRNEKKKKKNGARRVTLF